MRPAAKRERGREKALGGASAPTASGGQVATAAALDLLGSLRNGKELWKLDAQPVPVLEKLVLVDAVEAVPIVGRLPLVLL